ncbi:MAG: sigma-70 family RNA polymerase sigma factor [Verrucomicrobia bacterium]|nr:sigma-70 family RNA polymerase sigma factor [Verrucomicrobiota bacterium]
MACASVESSKSSAAGAGHFGTTHWSVVLTAGQEDLRGQEALARLCQTYWYPLYAYVRRQGHSPHDAQDLTQEFFGRLLEKHALAKADRSKGKFRSFLLASLKNFLANEWDKARALKRGHGQMFIPLDTDSAETRYHSEPADPVTPEQIFERQWALTLLEHVLGRLGAEQAAEGTLDQFTRLKDLLMGDKSGRGYAALAQQLNTTEGALRTAVYRLRGRYRELLREEIAHTVDQPLEIDDEIRHLFAVLAR